MKQFILADTSAWICFFSRKGFDTIKQSISNLLDENRIAVTGPVFVELIQGCRTEKEQRIIQDAFKGVHWLSITDDIWVKAAALAFSLRRKGITVSAIDSIIASVAMYYNCSLIHRDSDYELIAKHSRLSVMRV